MVLITLIFKECHRLCALLRCLLYQDNYGLESSPPSVIISLLRRVVDQLTARVEWSLGEHIRQIGPHGNVGDFDARPIANIDAEAGGVVATGVDARSKPETVLK